MDRRLLHDLPDLAEELEAVLNPLRSEEEAFRFLLRVLVVIVVVVAVVLVVRGVA